MTALSKKVAALFGKPELTAEAPAATIHPTPAPRPGAVAPAPVAVLTRPHINARGELIVPFSADPKYHYWKPGGQSLAMTLYELNAPPDVWRRYVGSYSETRQ